MINLLWGAIVNALTELVFPAFKDILKSTISTYLDELANNIKKQIEIINNNQSKTAQEKSQDAEEKAANATDPDDIAKYQAVAEVWKEVAEGLKKENKDLKQKIDSSATIAEELIEYKSKAEAWREAYESVQKDNEFLKTELSTIKEKTVSSFQKSVATLTMADLFDVSKPDQISLNKKNPLLNPSVEKDS
jgi:predicted RNase H-like nuclease (RuvC/YqgF family)